MSQYKEYKISLTLKSALGTKLMTDTIWGHICFGILYNQGEKALEEFIDQYPKISDKDISGKIPPLIISKPYNKNMLPLAKSTLLLEDEKIDNLSKYRKLKKKKKINEIPFQLYNEKIDSRIFEKMEKFKDENIENIYIETSRTRNRIDRFSNSTSENSLYDVAEYWYANKKDYDYLNQTFDVYIYSIYEKGEIYDLFKNGLESGYGADSSTGKGVLKVSEPEVIEFPKKGNIAMSLSYFVPHKSQYEMLSDDYGIMADIWTKYPKVYAAFENSSNPFKAPIIFYKEGSTFKIKDLKETEEKPLYCGCLLDNVHVDSRINQYALTPLIWIEIDNKTGDQIWKNIK